MTTAQVLEEGAATSMMPPICSLPPPSSSLISEIRELYKKRDGEMRLCGNIVRDIKSQCRRAVGFSTMADESTRAELMKRASAVCVEVMSGAPASEASIAVTLICETQLSLLPLVEEKQKATEKQIGAAVKRLPIATFVEETPGFGLLGLTQIIGEAGDLANYANPAKLWKRMGVGLISTGEAQRRFKDAAKANEAGYSPKRRSVMFVIGDSMLKAKGPYRDLYLQRLAVEHAKAVSEGLIPATTTAATVNSWKERGLPALTKVKKIDPDIHRGAGHMAKRAQRYMEKRLLRNLWRAWRSQEGEPIAQ